MLSEIDLIVWDFDGVINHQWNAGGFVWHAHLQRDLGITPEAFNAYTFASGRFDEVMRGKRDVLDVLADVLQGIEHNTYPQELLDYWFERDFNVDAEMLALMDEVQARGHTSVIGTNNEPRRAKRIWEDHGLPERAARFFTSGHVGHAKPDREFYDHIATEMQVANPARILLIDDTPHCIAGAQEAGWQAHQYGDSSKYQLGNVADLRAVLGL